MYRIFHVNLLWWLQLFGIHNPNEDSVGSARRDLQPLEASSPQAYNVLFKGLIVQSRLQAKVFALLWKRQCILWVKPLYIDIMSCLLFFR